MRLVVKAKNMDTASILFDAANIVNVFACALLMRSAIKDRNALKGFSVLGSVLTFVVTGLFWVGFYYMDNMMSFGFIMVPLVFWLLVSVFTLRMWINETRLNKRSLNLAK